MLREKHFPLALARMGLDVRVEDAQASQPADRRHILNAIAGRTADELDLEPHGSHQRYNELDQTLRGRFLAGTWRKLVEEGEDMARWAQPLASRGCASSRCPSNTASSLTTRKRSCSPGRCQTRSTRSTLS